ncbi:hypothetical protein D3C80_798400 [compost metagenome]
MQDRRIKVVEMQEDVILVLADAAAFTDFHRHAARHHVTRGKVFCRRRITLHEALAFGVDEITAFAARAFGNEAACAINAGRVELHEFHVLKRQAGTGNHAAAVAGAGVGRGRREIGAAVTAGRENHHLGGEAMDRAVIEVPRHDARATAVCRHDEVEREIFDKEFRVVAQRLAIKRVQDGVAGTVGGSAGALYRRAGAKVLHVAAERALVDLAFLVTRERNTIVLEFVNGLRRFHDHVLHGVDIAEPVGTLDGVIEVPLPAVRRHVLQRGGNAALRRDRVGTCRENLGDAGGLETLLGHAERGAKTRTAGAHDDNVVGMVDIIICFAVLGYRSHGCHDGLSYERNFQNGEKTEATDQHCKKCIEHDGQEFQAFVMHVVDDDFLNADAHVHETGNDHQAEQHGNDRVRQRADDILIRSASIADQENDEEDGERHQSHSRHPLHPEMFGAVLC